MVRKLLITPLLLLLFIAFVLYSGWNLFRINDGLQTLFLSRIQSTLGEGFSVEKMRLGLGTVNFEGIKLALADAPYEIRVGELQVGYSLASLLKGSRGAAKVAEEITVTRPTLTLFYDPEQAVQGDVDLSLHLSEEAEKRYRSAIKEYDFIKRITIDEGRIELLNFHTDESVLVATEISGWASTDYKDKARLRLAGHVFESDEYNTIIYGQIDLGRGGIDYVNVDLNDYELADGLPFLLPDYVEVGSGLVDGHISITEKAAPSKGFHLDGTVALEGGEMRIGSEHLYIEDIALQAEIQDRNIQVVSSRQRLNGSPTLLSGTINNFLQPSLDIRLSSDSLDVTSFLERLLPGERLPISGAASVDVTISESVEQPKIHGSIVSQTLKLRNKNLSGLDVDLSFSSSSLRFENLSVNIDDALLSGSGSVDFLSPEKIVDFDLNIAGEFAADFRRLGLTGVSSCTGISQIKVFGPVRRPVSTGTLLAKVTGSDADSLGLDGNFRFSQDGLAFTVSSPGSDLHLTAAADSVSSRPKYSIEATDIERLVALVDNPLAKFFSDRFKLNLTVEGVAANAVSTVDGYRKSNYEKIFSLQMDSSSESGKIVNRGDAVLLPNSASSVAGAFDFDLSGGTLNLNHVEFGDWFEGRINTDEDDQIHGEFSLSALEMSFINALMGRVDDHYRGNLFGKIAIEGTKGAAAYDGNFWLLDGFVGDVGPLTGQFSFAGDTSQIRVEKFVVEDAETDSLSIIGEGFYDFASAEIDAAIAGTNVRVEEVLALFTTSNRVVSGDAMVQVKLKGKLPQVPLFGSAIVHNAKILMLEFDEIGLHFGEEGSGNGSYISKRMLNVGHAELRKEGEFVLNGAARLPLRGGIPVSLDASGDGNFLALLPDMAEIFGDSKSQGHLDLKMAGGYKEPDFSGTRLKVVDGELRLSSVAKKVENIQADFEVAADGYFLDIHNLVGTVKRKPFQIKNTRVAEYGGQSYEPLRIVDDDLSLGALILLTPDNGVPLHIPGLMQAREEGVYEFQGHEPGEDFFVTGPWRRPKVRGSILARDANVMFPFDEGAGEGNPVAVNIMNNLDWDVSVTSEGDTRYVRQFPAGVFVDMEVDKRTSRLEFKGIMKDSTLVIGGRVESIRGDIDYLDLSFRVDKVGAEFNRISLYPNVYGRAWTVVRDSTNVPSDVYLTFFTVDETGQEVGQGSWDRINIKLSSEFPTYDETQGDLIASLGYSSDNIDEQARRAVGSTTDNFLFRPLLRPVERELEKTLQLDVVRFSYAITQNFLDSNFNNDQLRSSLAFLRSSRLSLGKYLTNDLYFLYTGQLKAGIDYQFQDKGIGLQHIVGLEYRLNKKWLLQMEYDYNTLLETHKDDKKVFVRHSFPF